MTTEQPDLTTGAQLHLTSIDAENTIIYCSKYNILYAFIEQPLAGGSTVHELPKNIERSQQAERPQDYGGRGKQIAI